MSQTIFSADFRAEPYWWDRTPRPQAEPPALERETDVLIVGSGYTGLSAAIQTARRGLQTLVLDAESLGFGCSTRNGGQISTSIKPDLAELTRRFGAERGLAIAREGFDALDWVERFVHENQIECDFTRVGRFYGAHSRAAVPELKARLAALNAIDALPSEAYWVSREAQAEEIATDSYHGGIVFPRHASIDPARYHQGLLECAQRAGVECHAHTPVTAIERTGDHFRVRCARGSVLAREVLIATNGYTGALTPWQRRRIIPIGSYIIATEPLPEETARRLIPKARVITDTRRLVVYYRLCPERRRVLFGARVSLRETDPRASAPALHHELVRRFPELAEVAITHSWLGFVGYTFDQLPHVGCHHGLWYSMGYCGSGVSLASYFGARIGQRIAGDEQGATALDGLSFPGRFYYRGNPWFLAPSISYYRWRDERDARRG